VFDLLESVLRGDAAAALAQLDRLYQDGADPLLVLQDLLDLGHFMTRLKLAPEAGSGDPLAEGDRERARPLADKLAMPALARLWQMLLKGLGEVQTAPSPVQAAEMVLVRLAYVADLPAPAELVRTVAGTAAGGREPTGLAPAAALPRRLSEPPVAMSAPPAAMSAPPAGGSALRAPIEPAEPRAEPRAEVAVESASPAASVAAPAPMPQSFAEVVALFDERREAVIRSHLVAHCHLVHFEPGRIELRPAAGAPRDLANRLGQLLGEWTGTRWLIAVSEAEGEATLRQQHEGRERDLRNEVARHPLVQAVLETFPGATIAAVRERFAAPPADADALPEADTDEANPEEDSA
jgi:DNA polymerase-3 subunit gamma/tau